ncbi:MAG TPA: hypothetical protein VN372_08585 [Methanospirillum sp.]|nr:hypothetical protein [Methanospirillum sp.]
MQPQYTENDEEIAKIFKDLGLKLNEARVLVVFFKGTNLSSRQIEEITSLPQSEVSVSLSLLIKKQWISIAKLSSEKKGRPVKIYALSLPVDEILDQIASEIEEECQNKQPDMQRVRAMLKVTTEGECEGQ